jgi:3-methyl-2-oxobutanoate hydroxymethyltransferase
MSPPEVTVPQVRASKRAEGAEPLVMVTAYDTPSARAVDAAGVDLLLVGDSVANVVLGHEDTLSVDVAVMVHHTAAVARARTRALVVADMPWLSYHLGRRDAVRNAARLVRAGAGAVKLEGGRRRLGAIGAILEAEIPIMGHLGLTPQSVHAMGGYRVQGRDEAAARVLAEDAEALAEAGCFALVLEGVPDELAARITASVPVPTIGIGAGAACDGQVLVLHDLIGLSPEPRAKFVRTYVDGLGMIRDAVAAFAGDVRSGAYPSDAETYHASETLLRALGQEAPPA